MQKSNQISVPEMDTISISRLKNATHREFMKDVLTVADETPAIAEDLPEELAALTAAVEEESNASLKEETTEYTKRIQEEVPERAKAQTALKSGFRAMMGMPDPQVAADAEALLELSHRYDLHFDSASADEQTGIITSFLKDLEENYWEQIQRVGMEPLYNQLKAKNDLVCDLIIQRDKSNVGKLTEVMAAARAATDEAYRVFRQAVNAYAYVKKGVGYMEFIGYVNVLILRYKRTHLQQSTSAPEATPGEETDGSVEEGGTNTPTPTLFTLSFVHNGQPVSTVQLAAGASITPPAAPSGYHWVNVPATMPAQNLTIHSAEDVEEPPILS